MYKFIPIIFAAVIAVGCQSSDSTVTDKGASTTGGGAAPASYTFKLAPKAGEKFVYDMSVDGGPAQGKMEMSMTMACEKVEGDNITMTMGLDSMKMGGKEAPADVLEMMKKSKTTMVMDSTGKTISSKTEGGSGASSDFAGAQFPTKALKIGDTWEAESGAGSNKTKATYKLVSVNKEGGKDIATLEVTPETVPNGRLDGPMIVKVDVANGMTVQMSMKMIAKGADGKETPSSMEMKLR